MRRTHPRRMIASPPMGKNHSLHAGGVLIRAIEPIDGVPIMERLRKTKDVHALTSGPGKLAKAFAIDKKMYGVDVTKRGQLMWLTMATCQRR